MTTAIPMGQIPGTAAALELSEKWLRLFKKAERNRIIKTALALAGGDHLAAFGPKRFTRYAYSLGYRVTRGTWKRKQRYQATAPLVFTGTMRASVARSMRATTSGTGDRPLLQLRFGRVWPATIVRATLTQYPVAEHRYVGAQLRRHLATLLRQRQPVYRDGPAGVKPRLVGWTLTGASTPLRGISAREADRRDAWRDARQDFDGANRSWNRRQAQGRAAGQAALARTHARWRGQSGGAAPIANASGGTRSRSPAERRAAHASAQRAYRQRVRARTRPTS